MAQSEGPSIVHALRGKSEYQPIVHSARAQSESPPMVQSCAPFASFRGSSFPIRVIRVIRG